MQTNGGYVALCLILPLLWGVLAARVFDFVQARRRDTSGCVPDDANAEMYHI